MTGGNIGEAGLYTNSIYSQCDGTAAVPVNIPFTRYSPDKNGNGDFGFGVCLDPDTTSVFSGYYPVTQANSFRLEYSWFGSFFVNCQFYMNGSWRSTPNVTLAADTNPHCVYCHLEDSRYVSTYTDCDTAGETTTDHGAGLTFTGATGTISVGGIGQGTVDLCVDEFFILEDGFRTDAAIEQWCDVLSLSCLTPTPTATLTPKPTVYYEGPA